MKAASLSGQLLARKGDAQPALAPARDAINGLIGGGPGPTPQVAASQVSASQVPERDAPQPETTEAPDRGVARILRPTLTPVSNARTAPHSVSSVTQLHAAQQGREIEFGGGGGSGGRETIRLSVRMGRERHRKLRILAAQRGISLQQAMIQAIDGLVSTATVQADTRHCPCLGSADLQPGSSKS